MNNPSKRANEAKPNFQRDILIPNLYSIENIKLIQSNMHERAVDKVLEQKKLKIEQKVSQILEKLKDLPLSESRKTLKSNTIKQRPKTAFAKTSTKASLPKTAQNIKNSVQNAEIEMLMEIDEEIGEKGKLDQQTYQPFVKKINKIMQKTQMLGVIGSHRSSQDTVNMYLNEICPNTAKTVVSANKFSRINGMIDDLKELAKTNPKNQERFTRPQTSKSYSKTKSRPYTPNTISHFRMSSDLLINTKRKSKNDTQKQKIDHLINVIQANINEQREEKKNIQKTLSSMQKQWKYDSKLQKKYEQTGKLQFTSQNLQLLRQKRIKSKAIQDIDDKFLK